jgi:uncharacterized protein (TIGR02145 family)
MQTTGEPTDFSIIEDESNGAFAIDNNGQVTVIDSSKINYEDSIFVTLKIEIAKDDADSKTASMRISILDSVEVANFTIDAIADVVVSSNVGYTGVTPVLSGDTPIGVLRYILSGDDKDHFAVDPSNGIISMVLNPDYYSPVDFNRDNVYEFTITITDADGNTDSVNQKVQVTLSSVKIGSQSWTEHNVRTIPTSYNTLNVDYWDYYTGDSGSGTSEDEQGFYYSYDAANNVCPDNWRLPSDDDWKTLESNLGMGIAAQDTQNWRGTDQGAQLKENGASGFNAKMPGFANSSGNVFGGRGDIAYFWTSTGSDANAEDNADKNNAYRRNLIPSESRIYRDILLKTFGLSVRCVQ